MPGRGATRILAAAAACAVALAAGASSSAADRGPAPQKPHPRVLGGGAADFSQWPFAAAILFKGKFFCSGSVLDSRHVITAGHCAERIKPGQLSVITGRADLRQGSVGEVIRVVRTFVDPAQHRHDIAILALASPTSSPAVALADEAIDDVATARGAPLRVAGWGATTLFQDKLPGYLKATNVVALPKKPCFRPYGKGFKSVAMICARGAKLGKKKYSGRTSPCAGDSGGPLISDTPAGPRLVGTVSFGPRLCGDPFAPVVYARISDDLGFINAALVAPL
jgi:secreted trypsin-like serine protease